MKISSASRELSSKLDLIKNKIGVYSGKGGVGKSTVAVNLAVMLAEMGHKVALFDCDIDCPNVAQLLRLSKGPQQVEDKFIPAEQYGVKAMSMGFFQQNEEEAIIWRGPMIHNAINQFTSMTEWGELRLSHRGPPSRNIRRTPDRYANLETGWLRRRNHTAGFGHTGRQAFRQYDQEAQSEGPRDR